MMRKPISKTELAKFIALTVSAQYDFEQKEKYKKLGRKILEYIAQEMRLEKGTYEIRWNPGGIACSGDHTLHTEKVYLALHDNLGSGWFYYRSCKGLRDYSGGPNQIVRWDSIRKGLEPLIQALKTMQYGYIDPDTHDKVYTPYILEKKANLWLQMY